MKRAVLNGKWTRLGMTPVLGLGFLFALNAHRWPGSTALAAVTAPTFVQEKDSQVTSGTAVSVTLASTASGNLIVAYVIWDNTGSASVSDSSGNVYASAVGPSKWNNSKYSAQVFYARNLKSGANTVKATFVSSVRSFGTVYAHEYSGVDQTIPIDVTAAAVGNSGSLSSGLAITTNATDLLFGGGVSAQTVTAPGSGYRARATSHGDMTEDKNVSTTGSYSATASNSGGAWAMQMVALRGASVQDITAPTLPSGLVTSAASSSQINLSWSASTDPDNPASQLSYGVYRNGVRVGTTTAGATAWNDTGLAAATTFTYTVNAQDPAGNASGQSASIQATTPPLPDTTAPTVPSGLVATASSTSQINLSWTASTDPDNPVSQLSYGVYRNGARIGTTPAGVTVWTDTGLVAATTYTYTVSAQDLVGNSSLPSGSAQATTLSPPRITSFTATPVSVTNGQTTTLSWVVSNATALTVDNGIGTVTGTSAVPISPTVATIYTLTATNSQGATTAQASVTVTPDTTPPTTPSGLTAATASASQINLNWMASTDNVRVAGYQVYRNGAPIATTALTTYADTNLTASTNYTYAVTAFDAAGNLSPLSSSASAATAPSGPLSLYTTNFPLTENPISEGGTWVNGNAAGLDWNDISTTPGLAFATRDGSTNDAHSIAILGGTWGADQTATATVHTVNQQSGSTLEDVELLLRFSIGAHSARGYDVNFSCRQDGTQYAQIVRWNGTLGDWTLLHAQSGPGLRDGDRVKATIVGSTITTYINDVAVFSVTDTTYASGNPGMGFSLQGGTAALASDYGFTAFTASDAPVSVNSDPLDSTMPSVPTNLAGSATLPSQISLSWTASTDPDDASSLLSYGVYRDGVLVGTITAGATAWNDTGLAPATTFTYTVNAQDPAGNASGQSASIQATTPPFPDTTAPTVPSGLVATASSTSQINLSWTASTDPDNPVSQLSYGVYRNGARIGTTPAGVTVWTDTGLVAATTYTYTVSAQDLVGNSSLPSGSAQATTLSPPRITSFTATPVSVTNGQTTTLSWVVSNATALTVDNGIGTVTGTSAVPISPTVATIYTLTATNSQGATTAQASVTVTPDTTPPTTPSGLTAATASASQINLNWMASTDNVRVAGYQVYRNGAPIATTALPTYADTKLMASTGYTYVIAAFDAAGNLSPLSPSASAPTSPSAPFSPYTTNFPLTENPISETGNWVNGKTTGLLWADVATIPGLVYGTEAGSTNYDDSTAVLAGSWGPDQTVQATVHTVKQNAGIFEEVELRLRTVISPNSITGYEVNFRCTSDGSQYVQVVRWNGLLGDFTLLESLGGPGLRDGDQVKATIVGSTITAYINDVAVSSATDSTFTNGNPGMGFYLHDGTGVNQDYGFTSFTASDGSLTVDAVPPSVPANVSGIGILSSQINLSWSASIDNVRVVGYQVFRDAHQVATTTTPAFSDTGLTVATTYVYAVSAFDAAGNTSAPSASVSVTTPPPDVTPPSIPAALQSSNITSSAVTLSWAASNDDVGVAGYQVFRNGIQVGTAAGTTYTDSGLASVTTYTYSVAAYDYAANVSNQSQPLVVSTGARPITPPTFVQVRHNEIASGTSVSAAFNAATTAGNTLVVYAIWSNAGSVTVTDSRGDTFVSVSGPTSWGGSYSAQVFYATKIAGGADTVTATFRNSVGSFGLVYAHEYAGISTVNPVDATAVAIGSSVSMSSGTVTTTSANDLIFGAGVSGNTVTKAGTGFAARDLTYGNITEDRTASTAGSYSATATQTGSAWAMQVVAFRAAN